MVTQNIFKHFASYILTTSKYGGQIFASKGDTPSGFLHVFKHGEYYIGFMLLSDIISESMSNKISLILESTNIKAGYTYSSQSLTDIWDLDRYKNEVGSEAIEKVAKYDDQVTYLPTANANIVNKMLLDRQKTNRIMQANAPKSAVVPAPVSSALQNQSTAAPVKPIQMVQDLADEYKNNIEKLPETVQMTYKLAIKWLSNVKTKEDLIKYDETLLNGIKEAEETANDYLASKMTKQYKWQIALANSLRNIKSDIGQIIPKLP